MMVLFAIIGAKINAGVWYWIFFWIMCAVRLCKAIYEVMED